MRVVTGSEMREIDRKAIQDLKMPSLDLMEAAGEAVARRAEVILKGIGAGDVVVIAGPGNNGGDGFVAARLLSETGHPVKVFIVGDKAGVKGDAAVNLKKLSGVVEPVFGIKKAAFLDICSRSDLIIDAIFGTGFRGTAPDEARDAICAVNHSGAYVLAVDIPSGVEADTGKAGGAVIEADETLTFGAVKVGCVLYPGAVYAGRVTVADIGFPDELTRTAGHIETPTPEEMAALLPLRGPETHKHAAGRVLLVAGSRGMTGAAVLAAAAILRAGAGIAVLACPSSLNDIFETKLTEVMTMPLPDTQAGTLAAGAARIVIKAAEDFDVLILGPGLSREPAAQEAIRDIISGTSVRLVLDADGLNAIAGATDLIKNRAGEVIITPHPGEMGRLLGVDSREVTGDRLAAAADAAARLNAVSVLKGAASVVADPDSRLSVNSTGNPGLATAGAGDVLAGLIGGLWAQHMNAAEAAVLGVYLHGLAGDLAAADLTEYSLVAGDLLEYIPDAFKTTLEAGNRPLIKSEE